MSTTSPAAPPVPERPARERRGLGLGEELHLLEPRGEIAAPEIRLGPGVARRIGGVEMHRPAGERPPVPHPRRRLGALAQRAEEGGDHVRERLPLAADHPGLAQERPAQHALQRAHVSPGLPRDQRGARRVADPHRAALGGEEHRRRQRVRTRLDRKATRDAVLEDGRGGVRGAEVDGEDVRTHGSRS